MMPSLAATARYTCREPVDFEAFIQLDPNQALIVVGHASHASQDGPPHCGNVRHLCGNMFQIYRLCPAQLLDGRTIRCNMAKYNPGGPRAGPPGSIGYGGAPNESYGRGPPDHGPPGRGYGGGGRGDFGGRGYGGGRGFDDGYGGGRGGRGGRCAIAASLFNLKAAFSSSFVGCLSSSCLHAEDWHACFWCNTCVCH